MSYWAATVITNFFSAVPYIGKDLVEFVWGSFSVAYADYIRNNINENLAFCEETLNILKCGLVLSNIYNVKIQSTKEQYAEVHLSTSQRVNVKYLQ